MALTWRQVKKAKSYIVYRYSAKSGKYKRVAVRNGKGANYYVSQVDGAKYYKYKVQAMSKKNGKGQKIGKRSYCVSAVTPESGKGNAVAVKTKAPKTVKLKRGKKRTLKATAICEGKALCNSSIRWYSSNKKIAKIGNKTGKITAKNKGTCYVWAKAHNGKNSTKIKVTVLAK